MPDSVVVGLFEDESSARAVANAARSLGVADTDLAVLAPGQSVSRGSPSADLLTTAAAAVDASDLSAVLHHIGVPDGEARFYADEARHGRSLVVLKADAGVDRMRQLVLERGGYDVQSRGRELIRPVESGVPGGVGARPVDVTDDWEDVRSRYQMLWQQHYGTTDATWEHMEPVYCYAWMLANRPEYRGRPWSEVEALIRRDWQASDLSRKLPWPDASGPVRDVWEDVAEEAATGAEGGADRRVASAGTDQSVPARDLQRPAAGAG